MIAAKTGISAFTLGDVLFADSISQVHCAKGRPIFVGLSGSQGSGKSTAAKRLVERLETAGLITVTCSLDDFYLTRAEREALAHDTHPLLATRGVPGTHDVALMANTVDGLLAAKTESIMPIPRFDKACDDRRDPADWTVHSGPCDVVLLEGWCVGAPPQERGALFEPINALEQLEDADGRWRRYVNDCLAVSYAQLFSRLDLRLMLRAPSFECVLGWRTEQEAGLSRRAPGARPPLAQEELIRFIAHYERITRWLLEDEPADLIANINASRVPFCWRHTESRA